MKFKWGSMGVRPSLRRRVRNACLVLAIGAPVAAAAGGDYPHWAFLFPDAVQPGEPARSGVFTLPGSPKTYTQEQADDHRNPPDWFPDQHPPLPRAAIAGGEGRDLRACASCHLTSGMGHPENSPLAGQPLAYLERQMADFRSGARGNHFVPGAVSTNDLILAMGAIARAFPTTDSSEALAYFAALKPKAGWYKVVEAEAAPKSYISKAYAPNPHPAGGQESLGQRIVELPQDYNAMRLRDPNNSGTTAYVPVGAVARGKALATAGPLACGACHGAGLKGVGDVPGIAGRGPLYNFRQLWMFKEGSRNGTMAVMMKASVANLSERDMIDLAAYLATLDP